MKGFQSPNYTQTPNDFFDEMIPLMDLAELRVTLVIMRNTFGWHRQSHKMSLSYLQNATGLSRKGVVSGIQNGINRGTIGRTPDGQSFSYHLVVNPVDQQKSTSNLSTPVKNSTSNLSTLVESETSNLSTPALVTSGNPTKKGKKREKKPPPSPVAGKDNVPAKGGAPAVPAPKKAKTSPLAGQKRRISPDEAYRRTLTGEILETLAKKDVDLKTFREMVDAILEISKNTKLANTETVAGEKVTNDARECARTLIEMEYTSPNDVRGALKACPWDHLHISQVPNWVTKQKPKAPQPITLDDDEDPWEAAYG